MLELAIRSPEANINVIKFINSHRVFDANKFYEKIRKSYNEKRSKLYINIMKETMDDPQIILTTLSSLNLQILIFCDQLEDKQMFLRHVRF